MSELSNRLREHSPSFGLAHLCDEAADALDANDARIEGLLDQHARDSAELRRLCDERDKAKGRVQALEAKCGLLAASLAQSEREVEQRDARIAKFSEAADGWKLVPVDPTETMVVCGFESRPDEFFSSPEEWAAYDAMSGCQQAAHRARLCYAAMLDAAPANAALPQHTGEKDD